MTALEIDLLPWREARRARRRSHFYRGLAAALCGGVLVVLGAARHWDGLLTQQLQRNALLRVQIAELDRRGEEMRAIDERMQALQVRLEALDALQRARFDGVHLLGELSRQVPEDVRFTLLRQTGQIVELRGVAASSAQIFELMRRLENSAWFDDAVLQGVETSAGDAGASAAFVIRVSRTMPPGGGQG